MQQHRMWRLLAAATCATVTACASTPRAADARLTPVAERLTDEAFSNDLAVFRGLQMRAAVAGAGAGGGRRYLATRATEWLALAQEAYERNDRSAFPEDLLVLAERDIKLLEAGTAIQAPALGSAVVFPTGVRVFDDNTWGRALTLRGDADHVGAPDEIARAEALLLRQGSAILAGPACMADGDVSRQAGAMLGAVERTRVNPTPIPAPAPPADTAKQVVVERPPPVPQPDSAPPPLPRKPRGACDGPEHLTGVPNAVHFALDKSFLAPGSREALNRTVARLREYPGVRIRLSGHTDPRASNAYNQALSQRRVDAVTAYLSARGVDASRVLRAAAMGEEHPLTPSTSVRDQARNRRVDIVYVLCDGSELVPEETVDDLQLEAERRRHPKQ